MITIKPENPTSDDNVEFEFLVHGCGFHEPPKYDHTSQFIFEADFVMVPCIVMMPPFPHNWSVGRLKAGEYEVILTQNNFEPVHQVFSVSEGILPFPEPAIPSIGFVGAIILAVGLAWIANKALKRTPKGAA